MRDSPSPASPPSSFGTLCLTTTCPSLTMYIASPGSPSESTISPCEVKRGRV